MIKDNVIYLTADMLDIPLHLMETDLLRGAGKRVLNLGPYWPLEAEVSICSDILEDKKASFLIRVIGNLWWYVISEEHRMTLTVLDGSVLGLHVKGMKAHRSKTTGAAMAKLKPAIKASYVFENTAQEWRKFNAVPVVKSVKI